MPNVHQLIDNTVYTYNGILLCYEMSEVLKADVVRHAKNNNPTSPANPQQMRASTTHLLTWLNPKH